ncbi:MAG: fumarylacetoacetate hydrolase family protein [Deltaproteobacteria bacterium]|nr:fumarylacetoacetate hydrolase family protein [Deltaproteobacteria bacterium]
MKIAQYYDKDIIRLGLIQSDSIVPIDFNGDMIAFIKSSVSPEVKGSAISLNEVKLAPPVNRPSKIIAIGLNYRDHAEESKGKIPEVPLIFAKFPNSLAGHNEEILWDVNVTRKVDFEAELAVVMGKKVYNCTETEAMEAVFGYTCGNDVSARDLQFGDGQWVRGKSLDTFCPIGPWIVTPEEIPDPHVLKIQCQLNGRLMQDSNTNLIIFKVPTLISFISKHFTLLPGDIILTGTPKGVGAFRNPSVYMKNGDEVVVEIENIGRLVNQCRTKKQ